VNQTKTTAGVETEAGFLASWALTMESRLSCVRGIAHHKVLNGQHGHHLVCEARLSQSRKLMTSELALRASLVVR
jgi:hypothetical protein